MNGFNVTYSIVTPESAEHGDYADIGFVAENVSLREGIELLGNRADQTDSWPVRSPRWIENNEYGECYRTGARESRALHLPEHLTESTRMRIWRYLRG